MTAKKKITLGQVFKQNNLEVLTYIDKSVLADNNVVFCISSCNLVEITNSKFDIDKQWQLTIQCQATDSTLRKYWLTMSPNEVRNDYMDAIKTALQDAANQECNAVHSCILRTIPSQYDHPTYVIDTSDSDCHCTLDA